MTSNKKFTPRLVGNMLRNLAIFLCVLGLGLTLRLFVPTTVMADGKGPFIPNQNGAKDIFVDSVIFGEDEIPAGDTQLIQSLVANASNYPYGIITKVRVRDPNGKQTFLPEQKGLVLPRSLHPFIFEYVTDPELEGIYRVTAYVLRADNEQVIYTAELELWFFRGKLKETDDDVVNEFEERPVARNNADTPSNNDELFGAVGEADIVSENVTGTLDEDGNGLRGISDNLARDPALVGDGRPNQAGLPGSDSISGSGSVSRTRTTTNVTSTTNSSDLAWKDIQILNSSILRGEPNIVRGFLINTGREIAKNANYEFFLVTAAQKESYREFLPVLVGSYPFIAPGESKLIELYINVPTSRPVGRYIIVGEVDGSELITELDESNNVFESNTFDFNEVAQIEPEEGLSINPSALITFSWRSVAYNRFSVEVSPDVEFDAKSRKVKFPTNEPTPLSTITLLQAEMDIVRQMATEANTNTIYWRVVGQDGLGNFVSSLPRGITLNETIEQ